MGCGGLILDSGGDVLDMNTHAETMLKHEVNPTPFEEQAEWSRRALKNLLRRAGERFRIDSEAWIKVPRNGAGALVLHALPLSDAIESGPHTVLTLVDLSVRLKPSVQVLQRLFDLTAAEARVAIEIGNGKALNDVAEETGLSNATLRTQLSSVFTKTHTRRQPELVALLARVSILP